ncbi:MAG TPA: AI-2E family transporter [Patescibacteria group bacterium]|nr:AI-2E family transporter [Patescibacteria group bacterium]
MPRKVEISHKTIIFTVLFLLFLWFLFYIKDILLELFVAILLMTVLQPLVNLFTKIRIPRALSVFLSYIIVFGLLGGVIALIIPTLVDQTTSFVNALPLYFSNLGMSSYVNADVARDFLNRLGSLPGEVFKFTVSVFTNIASVLTVLVFTFYMLLSRNKLEDQLGFLFGEDNKRKLGFLINDLEARLGGWARGQFTLMFLVGLATYIGLLVVGIPFALPLAILAGLLEIIPYLGPVVAAIPSIIIGFGISPVLGAMTAGVAIIIQQLENYVLVPKVMEKSVGVSPIVTLVALAIGARFLGIVGMIISIPTVIALQVIFKHFVFKKE